MDDFALIRAAQDFQTHLEGQNEERGNTVETESIETLKESLTLKIVGLFFLSQVAVK